MTDPKTLKVNDKVKFISMPEEWANPKFEIDDDSLDFMSHMIKRGFPSRVYEVDEAGHPWIAANIKQGKTIIHHSWLITENSGWRKVEKRT